MKNTKRVGPNRDDFVGRSISALRVISQALRRTARASRAARPARLELGLPAKSSIRMAFCENINFRRQIIVPAWAAAVGALCILGCATIKVGPTPMLQASQEIPEDQLLDVGIVVFSSEPMTPEEARKEGTNPEIRKAEQNFIPYHLKNTLQQSSQWGTVRVLPGETESADLLIKGRIIKSTGETLEVRIEARDATGRVWLDKTYEAEATSASYSSLEMGEKDAFQDLYNRVANDLAEQRMKLSPQEAQAIRTVAQLRFANRFAPEVYNGYLKRGPNDLLTVNRLPAQGDPMMGRLLKIRDRELLFVDTLNQQYEGFYARMWPSYENWRRSALDEQKARDKIERDALIREVGGALLLAGAIALGAARRDMMPMAVGMGVIGGQVIYNGYNLSKQTEMHSESIRELSETFGSEMKPILVEFEGQTYELTGPAEEQFKRWRELLREIYRTETGFDEGKTGTPQPH
jgi:hypothetical protein